MQKHARLVRLLGQDLQTLNHLSAEEIGQLIEECGTLIQEYAQEAQLYTEFLHTPSAKSTQLYTKVVQLHVQANRAHIQAVRLYTRLFHQAIKRNLPYRANYVCNKGFALTTQD